MATGVEYQAPHVFQVKSAPAHPKAVPHPKSKPIATQPVTIPTGKTPPKTVHRTPLRQPPVLKAAPNGNGNGRGCGGCGGQADTSDTSTVTTDIPEGDSSTDYGAADLAPVTSFFRDPTVVFLLVVIAVAVLISGSDT